MSKNEFIGDQNVTGCPNTFAKEDDCFPSSKFVPVIYLGRIFYLIGNILPRLPSVGCCWNGRMGVRFSFTEAQLGVHEDAHIPKKMQVQKKKSTWTRM